MRSATFLRKRRLILVVIALAVGYLFIKYLPTDVPSVGQRIDVRTGKSQGRPFPFDPAPLPVAPKVNTEQATEIYDGPVKFYHLAASLRPHAYSQETDKEAVLFLLYDLRSAPSILGTACPVARQNRTVVHVALLSMKDDPIDSIMSVNGIAPSDCPVYWHDARPDYNGQSTPARQDIVIKSALSHMHTSLKPKVVLMDRRQAEITRLKSAVQSKLDAVWIPLVVLPNDAPSSMSWLNSLDATSLSLLHRAQIDIVIAPYRQSAGTLIRLLESIKMAEYAGLPLPRIIVEIPQDTDRFALNYLENFRWPTDSPTSQSKLILRRALDSSASTSTSASLHTLESFYPPSFPMSHVLVLDPSVELSPTYFQYLYFTTLEYKYSKKSDKTTTSLMGISLNLPSTLPDDKTSFMQGTTSSPLLLHQTPSSTATLYFGDKWVELQDYVTLRLKQDPTLAQTITSPSAPVFSHTHPSWLHQASELMQSLNYFILYPSFATSPDKQLVTVHTELSQRPEEFWVEPVLAAPTTIPALTEKTVLTDAEPDVHAHMAHHQSHGQSVLSLTQLFGLDERQAPPKGGEIPLFSAMGEATTSDEARKASDAYADEISLQLGRCSSVSERDKAKKGRVEYLFCGV